MSLRIKLLRLYVDTERVDQAYNHAIKVEALQPFPKCYDWYTCLLDIYEVCLISYCMFVFAVIVNTIGICFGSK